MRPITPDRTARHQRPLQAAALLGLVLLSTGGNVSGSDPVPAVITFDIPPTSLDHALLEYSRQSGRTLVATGELRRINTRPVRGNLTAEQALQLLLDGSGFTASIEPDGLVRIQRAPAVPGPASPALETPRAASPAPEVLDLARMSVTARRREEQRIDVPISVGVIEGEDIETLGLANASEALRLLPGVTTVDGGTSLTQVQIRGVSSSLGGNDNAYYLDEVLFTGVTVPWHPDTRAFDLERVEVLKGPQGALFGEGAMGGTVRILTRAPDPDRFAAHLELARDRVAEGGSGPVMRGMANVPLAEGRLALRAVATYEALPAWIDSAGDRAPGNRHVVDTHRLRLRWTGERWTTDLSHILTRHDSPGGGYVADDDGRNNAGMDTVSRWHSSSLVANTDLDASRMTLLAAQARLDYGATGLFAVDIPAEIGIGITVSAFEARWASTGDGPGWVFGYTWRQADRDDILDVDGMRTIARQRNHAHALFAELSGSSDDRRWSWSGGLRWFRDHVDAGATATGYEGGMDGTFARLNPKVSLSRHFSPRRSLHASISTGFRAGQLQPANSLMAAKSLGINLPGHIDGDHIVSCELGYTHATESGRSLWQAALFRSDWSKLPVRVPLDGVSNGLANSGGARIDGIEFGLVLLPAYGWKLDLGATLVDARYRRDVPGTPIAAGTQIYNVPRSSMFSAVSYRRTLPAGLEAIASAHVSHHSARRTGLVEGAGGDPITQFALRLGLDSGRGWAIWLYGDNLLDERGAVDGRNLAGVATRLRPRSAGIELHLGF